MARNLQQWIEKTFVDRNHWFSPAPGVREQKVCFNIMSGHCLHWGGMIATMFQTTGDKALYHDIVQTLNYSTYFLQPDNRIIVGMDHGATIPQGGPLLVVVSIRFGILLLGYFRDDAGDGPRW